MAAFSNKSDPGYGSFHSELSNRMANPTTNAECTLTLRVYLNKIDPAGGAATGTFAEFGGNMKNIQKWTDLEWYTFKKSFRRRSQAFWHGKFWLQHDTCNKLDWPYTTGCKPTHRPNVYCRFRMKLVNKIGDAHRQIQCVRPQVAAGAAGRSTTFRSFVANVSTFDYFDIIPTTFSFNAAGKQEGDAAKVSYQIVHYSDVHEVGHLLGLPHSNEDEHWLLDVIRDMHAGGNHTHDDYGDVQTEQEDVMGYGGALNASSAQPWKDRVAAATGTSPGDWKVLLHPYRKTYRPRLLSSLKP